MKRRPLILLILSILLCLTLWLVRGWWLPIFQSWLPQLAGDLGNWIQSLEAIVGLIVLIGGGILGLWSWLARGEQGNHRDDDLAPLRPTTWQMIRDRSPQGARVQWVDRGATDANHLRAHPRLAISGLGGEGKSREAAELMRRAVEIELLAATQVFEPNRDFLNAGATLTHATLDKVVDPAQRAFLLIDDLHSYSAVSLVQLTALLSAFTRPQLDHRYVVVTVRSDLVSAEQTTWLAQQNFQMVKLPRINAQQSEQWLNSAGAAHSLTLTKKVRQSFIAENRQGTPGHLLRGLLTVKSTLVDNNGRRSQIKAAQVAAVMSDISAQERQALCRRFPPAAYLLTALAHFHAAEVRTAHPLVLAYAAALRRRDRTAPGRWQRWWTGRTLRRALTYLVNFDVIVQQGLIVAPDALIEGTAANHARQQVGDFLVAYRRPLHNRLLRRLHRHAEAQRWALFELALHHQKQQEYVASERFYTLSIQINPHPWCYNNRGSARKAQGEVVAAIADYDQAIRLNPQYATAYYNRGLARADLGEVVAASADYDQAIRLNPQYATAYINRGNARKAQGEVVAAIADYDQAIRLNPELAEAYGNRALSYEATGDWNQAAKDLRQAAELFTEVRDKALALKLLGDSLRHLEEWSAAATAYQQGLALDESGLWDWVALADAARHVGDEATWIAAVTQARARLDGVDAYGQACVESVAGNHQQALDWLAQAAAQGEVNAEQARQSPDLAWVRADPRFEVIVDNLTDRRDIDRRNLEQAVVEAQATD